MKQITHTRYLALDLNLCDDLLFLSWSIAVPNQGGSLLIHHIGSIAAGLQAGIGNVALGSLFLRLHKV